MAASFDLRRFAPPRTSTFTLWDGRTYSVPGDVDTDVVCRMLRLEIGMGDHQFGDEAAVVLEEAKQELMALIRKATPDVDLTDFAIAPQELGAVFAFMLHGPTVAEAVQEAISAAQTPEGSEGEEPADGAAGPVVTAETDDSGAAVTPLPSRASSSRRSSGSDAADDTPLAIGTA